MIFEIIEVLSHFKMFLFYSNCTIIIHDGQISTMMVEHHPGLSVVFVLLNLLPVWYLLYFINHCLSLWTRSFGHYVAHLFKLMSCSSMCLYVLSSVLCCPVRFLHNNYVRSSLPPDVCIRAHVLFALCSYFIFLRLRCLMLPVSLDCPFFWIL